MPRPATHPVARLNPKLALYLCVDLFGFLCLALGVAWFAGGPGVIFDHFPRSTAEAAASAAGGIVVIGWAISRILRELARLAPPPASDD